MGTTVRARGTLDAEMRRRGKLSRAMAQRQAEKVADRARELAPKKTNELAESIKVSKLIELEEGLWRIEIRATAPHAAALERGSGIYAEARPGVSSKPYVILPVKGKVLAFVWPAAPEPLKEISKQFPLVFLTRVEHRGVRGTKYLRTALKENTTRTWSQIVVALAEG